jgi:hypothetical protein
MKTTLTLLFATVLALFKILDFSIGSQGNSRLDGTWQLIESNYGMGSAKSQVVLLKVLHEGRFEGYFLTPQRSGKTMNGNFEILNDSFVETWKRVDYPAPQ